LKPIDKFSFKTYNSETWGWTLQGV
jgi:hypothetical protein